MVEYRCGCSSTIFSHWVFQDSGCGVLASLPSAASSGKYADNAKIGEEELEELVGRKQWELKLAKKAERKRRKKEKKAKKLLV